MGYWPAGTPSQHAREQQRAYLCLSLRLSILRPASCTRSRRRQNALCPLGVLHLLCQANGEYLAQHALLTSWRTWLLASAKDPAVPRRLPLLTG